MWRYSQHIQEDISEILYFINVEFGDDASDRLLDLFMKVDPDRLSQLTDDNSLMIREFVKKSPSQRPAYIRKITKELDDEDMDSRLLFFITVITVMGRAQQLMELSDRYGSPFTPGGSYRSVAANAASIAVQAGDLRKPWFVYEALGLELPEG